MSQKLSLEEALAELRKPENRVSDEAFGRAFFIANMILISSDEDKGYRQIQWRMGVYAKRPAVEEYCETDDISPQGIQYLDRLVELGKELLQARKKYQVRRRKIHAAMVAEIIHYSIDVHTTRDKHRNADERYYGIDDIATKDEHLSPQETQYLHGLVELGKELLQTYGWSDVQSTPAHKQFEEKVYEFAKAFATENLDCPGYILRLVENCAKLFPENSADIKDTLQWVTRRVSIFPRARIDISPALEAIFTLAELEAMGGDDNLMMSNWLNSFSGLTMSVYSDPISRFEIPTSENISTRVLCDIYDANPQLKDGIRQIGQKYGVEFKL